MLLLLEIMFGILGLLFVLSSDDEQTTYKNGRYSSDPSKHLLSITYHPGQIKLFTHFDYEVFMDDIYYPCFDAIIRPRNGGGKHRACQISPLTRLVVFFLRLGGNKSKFVACERDQSIGTDSIDLVHIAIAINESLGNEWLKKLDPNTPEYNQLKGVNNLAAFPGVNLVGDIRIRRPSLFADTFWDGHHKIPSLGYLVFCDGFGYIRNIHGGLPGSCSDIQIWNDSDFNRNINNYFRINEAPNVLFDSAFRGVNDNIFICPIRHPLYRRFNLVEIIINRTISSARIIIENVFGRVKWLFPLFIHFTLKRDNLDLLF